MKVGITYHLRNPREWFVPWPDFYKQHLDHMCAMEDLGYDEIWIQQHHFEETGYGASFAAFAGALSALTKRIRVGSDILILPLKNPLVAAEEMALLDNLLCGRLDVGVGLGHRLLEFDVLSVPFKQRPSRMEEGVAIMRLAWTQDPVTYHGRRYSFQDINVQPKPVQNPHPPIWMASRALASAQRAARLRCHLLASSGVPSAIYHEFFRGLESAGEDPALFHSARSMAVTITDEPSADVWERHRPHAVVHYSFHEKIIAEVEDPPLQPAADQKDFELIGPPEDIIQSIRELHQEDSWNGHSWDTITLHAPLPGMSLRDSIVNFERFAKDVAPAIQDLA